MSVYKVTLYHSRENGKPVISKGYGLLLEFASTGQE